MEPVTYKLNPDRSAFSTYYRDVISFTDDVLIRSESSILSIVQKYRNYLYRSKLEDCRTVEEYTYEFLNLGVLWRAHGNTGVSVQLAQFQTMAHLGEGRKTHQKLKPIIEVVRGILLSFFLVPIPVRRTM